MVDVKGITHEDFCIGSPDIVPEIVIFDYINCYSVLFLTHLWVHL